MASAIGITAIHVWRIHAHLCVYDMSYKLLVSYACMYEYSRVVVSSVVECVQCCVSYAVCDLTIRDCAIVQQTS